MPDDQLKTDANPKSSPKIHTLSQDYAVPDPSEEKRRAVMIHRTTCTRWVEVIGACKTRRINLLGVVANVLIGTFLTALGPAISDIHVQSKFELSPWIAIAMLALLGAVISGAAYLQVGTYESGSLTGLLGEMRELLSRFDADQDHV